MQSSTAHSRSALVLNPLVVRRLAAKRAHSSECSRTSKFSKLRVSSSWATTGVYGGRWLYRRSQSTPLKNGCAYGGDTTTIRAFRG